MPQAHSENEGSRAAEINKIRDIHAVDSGGYRPDPYLNLSDWADQNRILSNVSSAEPGRWRTSRTPYLREIMDCLSARSTTNEVVFMKGSQIGGSECGLNWLGYLVEHNPGPTLIVQPTDTLAKRFSRQRLDGMFRDTPSLAGKIREKKSRDSSNTMLMKEFAGGMFLLVGANSAVQLRSMPIKNANLEEVDGYPDDVNGEGDPVKLAEKRTSTFPKRKIFKNSTPTIEGKSRIKDAFDASSRGRYYVPCPFCGHFQTIEWSRIKWEKKDPSSAKLQCESCKELIEEKHKTKMLEQGKWIHAVPEHRVRGFHLSALYSPVGWYSWSQAAREFMEAQQSDNKLRVFINTVLGETWKEKGEAPEWERIYERRELYPFNLVPVGALFLTAGVDVQKDRFEVEIVGWGRDKQSWSIDYRVIYCETSDIRSYAKLDEILDTVFPVEGSKTGLEVKMLAVDSGYNTQTVYAYARAKGFRVMAVKGFDREVSIVGRPSAVEVSYGGKTIPRGVRMWPVSSPTAKTELYGWLRLPKPTNPDEKFPPGYCHFPQYNDDHFRGLTAEQVVRKIVRGYPRYVWEKIRERNEQLDARIYARAAAAVVGLDRYNDKDWNDLELALRSKKERASESEPQQKTKGGIPVRESDYL